jgi:hypothetical protein
MDDVCSGQNRRSAEEFAEAVDKIAAREGGLSDVKMMVVLKDAVERLDEGLSAA